MSDKFMFFRNFKQIADGLPDDLRLQFYDAMCAYAFDETEPDNPIIASLVQAIKPSLEKHQNWGGVRNGAGRPKQNQDEKLDNQDNQDEKLEKKEKSSFSSLLETEAEAETEIEIKEKKIKKKKTMLSVDDVELGEYEIIRPQIKKWIDYKKNEKNEGYKTTASLIICVKKLYELANGDPVKANDIVEQSIANGYKGLYSIKQPQSNAPRMSFKDMKEIQNEMDIQKVLRGEL